MNQIIFLKNSSDYKIIFLLQFIISLLFITFLFINILINNGYDKELENLSNVIDKNVNLSNLYNKQNDIYFGKIYINKINIEYIVFNKFSDDLLKISPCKFYGKKLGDVGNICIVGHNYENDSFFSNIYKLEDNDEIILESLDGKKYKYVVYDKKEINSNDISILENTRKFELTLLTCNNSNKKRYVIKASMNKI